MDHEFKNSKERYMEYLKGRNGRGKRYNCMIISKKELFFKKWNWGKYCEEPETTLLISSQK